MKTLLKTLLCLLAICFTMPAFAQNFKEFSADMVDVKSGNVVGKLAVVSDKIRADNYDAKGKLESISIVRMDQRKMYAFIEYNKSYMELPVDENFTAADLNAGMVQSTREKVGTESVGGYQADKYKITATVMGMTSTAYEWIAPEFDPLPIRTEQGGEIAEMRNIKMGAPSASLFELPSGYKHDTNMENMVKEMMASKPAAATGAEGNAQTPAGNNAAADAAADVTKEVATDVGSEVKSAVKDNLREGARDGVNKAFKGLFGK